MSRLLLALLLFVGAFPAVSQPAPDLAATLFERYRQMSLFSRVEDAFATDHGFWPRSATAGSSANGSGGARTAALPRQRAEWASRVGAGTSGLGFGDLASFKEASLLDEALWALLQARAPDPFAADVDWTVESRPFRNFLRATGVDSLDRQVHGPWWIWFRDGRLVAKSEPLLRALHFYIQGRVLRGTLKLESWMEARQALAGSFEFSESFDRRIFSELLKDEKDPLILVDSLVGVRRKDLASLRPTMLRSYARFLRGDAVPHVSPGAARVASVRAEAQSILLRLRAGDKPKPTELLNLAVLEAEIGESAYAERFARAAVEAGSTEGGQGQDLGFLSKALEAFAKASRERAFDARDPGLRRRRLEWATEHTRRALGVVGRSSSRNDLLLQYAELLNELGQREEANRVFDDLFSESVDRSAKAAALRAQTRFIDAALPSARNTERVALFRDFLGKASLLRQWSSKAQERRWLLDRSRYWSKSLGLDQDKAVQATLREMESAQ